MVYTSFHVTVFASGTFDLFDGHFDGENGMGTQPILLVKESVTIDTMLNFNGDFNLFVGRGSTQISIHLNHQNDQFDTFSKL